MKKIKLTQGKYALVDDADFEYLNQWKWFASRHCRTFYARRNQQKKEIKNGQKRKAIYMHRVMLNEPSAPIDHADGNGLNNMRSNLNLSTPLKNAQNKNNLPINNTSGALGISWSKRDKRWRARINRNGKEIHLGNFIKLDDAVKARKNFIFKEKNENSSYK